MKGISETMVVAACLWVIAACKPGTPSQYIQPDDMEDVLVDYHLARALAQNANIPYDSQAVYQALYEEAALAKHGVTRAQFDSSLVYYYTRSDRFKEVYQRVSDRLEEQALILGASEGEIGKYASYSTTGDTANVWSDRTVKALLPIPPYNRWDFTLEIDSTYRAGDKFLFQFMGDYMFQDGARNGTLYMAVTYANDTTISRNLHFTVSGLSKLEFSTNVDSDIKAVKGFFYLGEGTEHTTSTRILFLSNVQLIRFHTKKAEDEIKKDSLAQAGAGGQLDTDSVGGRDSVGVGEVLVSPDPGTATNRVAPRRNLPKARN